MCLCSDVESNTNTLNICCSCESTPPKVHYSILAKLHQLQTKSVAGEVLRLMLCFSKAETLFKDHSGEITFLL